MPRACTICVHPKRNEIDAALISNDSLRDIAERYGTKKTILHRHKASHIPTVMAKAAKAAEATDVAHGGDMLAMLAEITEETKAILREERDVFRDNEKALKAIARLEKQIELLGRFRGELDNSTKVVNLIGAGASAMDKIMAMLDRPSSPPVISAAPPAIIDRE